MKFKHFVFYKIYKYKTWHDKKIIHKVIFPIHWDRSIQECVNFDTPVTLGYALYKVEAFLSKKLTQKYINKHHMLKQYQDKYKFPLEVDKKRADLLGGYYWLETIDIKNGILTLDYSS